MWSLDVESRRQQRDPHTCCECMSTVSGVVVEGSPSKNRDCSAAGLSSLWLVSLDHRVEV